MFRKKIPEDFIFLGSKLTAVFIITLCFMSFSLIARAELGGFLYQLGTNPTYDKTYPQLGWDGSNPMGKGASVLAGQPRSHWMGHWNLGDEINEVAGYVEGALLLNQVPALTVYNIPYKDCGQASGAVPMSKEEYKQWIDKIANGIKLGIGKAHVASSGRVAVSSRSPILIFLEPDSIGLIPTESYDDVSNAPSCWRRDRTGKLLPLFNVAERWEMLDYAVQKLSSAACYGVILRDGILHYPEKGCGSFYSRVKVYMDGGNSGWQSGWIDKMADRLIKAGVSSAQGIFTNASNFHSTTNEISFGVDLLAAVNSNLKWVWCNFDYCEPPSKTQIIDVSRNGADIGSYPTANGGAYQDNGWPYWCDNRLARVGQHPTLYSNIYVNALSTRGPISHVDGLVWIKPMGETDGCWGGTSTQPNTQPKTVKNDLGDTRDPSKNSYETTAGWASYSLACGLVTGKYYNPNPGASNYADAATIAAACDLFGSASIPRSLKIVNETRISSGAAANTVTLEWEPSTGACKYQIAARVDGGSDNQSVVKTIVYFNGKGTPGTNEVTATRYVVNPAVKGAKVQYSVRAVACKTNLASRYSASTQSTTYNW
jgi:Glycosyl hydrolases family 6